MTTTPLPPLPKTPYLLYYQWPDDEYGFNGSEVVDCDAYTADQMQAYASQARADLEAENKRLLDTIDAIYIYANDTLSGRTDGPDDREWQRAAVVEIRNRARKHATVDSAVFARADLEAENQRPREALELIANTSMDAKQCMQYARTALEKQP